jgi:hypothetical protein
MADNGGATNISNIVRLPLQTDQIFDTDDGHFRWKMARLPSNEAGGSRKFPVQESLSREGRF